MKRSFTVIELAVTGSLIAAALAALLPASRSIRQQDRLAGCLANLRAIGTASLTYAAADPNEAFIPVANLDVIAPGSGPFEWGGKAGRGESTLPDDITYSYFGTRDFRGPAHRPLNPVLYKGGFADWNPPDGTPQPGPGSINYIRDTQLDLDVYRCPSDTGYAGGGFYYTGGRHLDREETPFVGSGLSAYDHYGNSYVANTFMTGAGGPGAQLSSNSPYLRALSSIPAPGRTLGYDEIPARCTWLWGDWDGSGCEFAGRENLCVGNFATVSGWHGRAFDFNVTFVDGHAGTVERRGCYRPAPHLGPPNYPLGGCGSSDPYACYLCVMVRGPGWQIDTLPAPAVLTPWTN